MSWGLYLLILSGIFSAVVSLYLYHDTERYKFLGILCASFFFIIIQLGLILQQVFTGYTASFILEGLVQWGSICCIALVLSSLLLFLREMKPDVLRFHRLYSVLPLLTILSFFLIYDSELLKSRLLTIYVASAALVSIILYGTSFYQKSIYRTAFIGVLILSASFVLHFLLPLSYEFIVRIVLAVGITTLFSGYLVINTSIHEGAGNSYPRKRALFRPKTNHC